MINGRAERFVGAQFDSSVPPSLHSLENKFVFKYWPREDGWVLVKHPMMSKGNEMYIDFLQSMSRFGDLEIFHIDLGSKWILKLV